MTSIVLRLKPWNYLSIGPSSSLFTVTSTIYRAQSNATLFSKIRIDNVKLCLSCAFATKQKTDHNKILKSVNENFNNKKSDTKSRYENLNAQSQYTKESKDSQITDKGGDIKKEDPLLFEDVPGDKKLGLFAKFKIMYKKYWYILIPVHVVTSIGWFGGFYYLSKSGVDIVSILQSLHVSESITEKLKGSEMGHIAVAYLCYKIATPARYAVTVGGTTISIKYLVQAGYIKPMPTKAELIQMYEDKKAKIKQDMENRNNK